MIYTDNTKKAINIMFEAHKDQFDKDGMPYVFHPWHVAEQMSEENAVIVALLHDVVEDTDMTFQDLEKYNFPEEVLEALTLLTHKDGIDYYDYIENISTNSLATEVKLADLKHNMDLNRLSNITLEDFRRIDKYKKCYNFLLGVQKKEVFKGKK